MQTVSAPPPRIFVSIASFCDPMLAFTVRELTQKARHPDRLALGIVDQSPAPVDHFLPAGAWRTACLRVDPHQSRGACWARALAMTLHAGEDYFFQIDSHTALDRDWDVTLIEALEAVSARSGNVKSILSTRPFAFGIGDDGTIHANRFTANTLKLVPKEPVLKRADPVMSFACHDSGVSDDLPGFQVSAAYLFTRGSFVEEIPYDPYLYFHGEEQNLSIRAFTHGWDIWHPNAVPLYHLYKSRADGEAPLHWDSGFEDGRGEKWTTLRARASHRLADLIDGRLTGSYGPGAARTIGDYLRFAGIRIEKAEATIADTPPETRGEAGPSISQSPPIPAIAHALE